MNSFLGTVAVLLILIFVLHLSAENPAVIAAPVATPFSQIDLSSLGYREPPRTERLLNDESVVSLDFVDAKHVLVTFDGKKLLTRLPGCPPSHDDRMIHAAIIQIPGGKVVKETDWYLHDRRRYLWPLGDGRFLLRKLNTIYLLDSSLHEQLLLTPPNDTIAWMTVSADGKQIIFETEKANGAKASSDQTSQSSEKTNPKYLLNFFKIDSHTLQETIESKSLVHLNAAGTGYADVLQKGDVWLVRFGPSPVARKNIARVRSRCTPDVFYSSDNTLLIGRCPVKSTDYSVTAFTVTGHRLWHQNWNRERFLPAVVRSGDRRRFAVSNFTLSRPAEKDSTESDPDILEQNIQILETASGHPVQSLIASPAVIGAQNFSLSPDGTRFAILHNSQIELYNLPKVSEEEQAKFTALKADVPGLYIVPKADSSTTAEAEDPADTAADIPSTSGAESIVPFDSKAPAAAFSQASISPASATRREDSSRPMVTFKAGTQVVVVDVVVTDGKGHPVKGLPAEDFQLAEDGRVQRLHSFHEFGGPEPAPVPPKPETPSSNVFSNRPDAPDPGSVTVVLLDLLNTPVADQLFARKQLIKFLKSKPKNLQFALCTLSADKNSHLRLIQGFTLDEDLLLAAVNGNKAGTKPARLQKAAETQDAVNSVTELASGDPMSHWENLLSGLQKMQAYEQESDTNERVSITIDAFSQLARYLSGIPGRKNLVWLSGSFPVTIAPNPELDNPSVESHNYSSMVRQAASLLAQGQIAVYPVDVRGLLAGDISAASSNPGLAPMGARSATTVAAGQAARDGSFSKPGQLASISPNEAFQDQTMQALAARSAEFTTMNQVAQETGGKAFYNTNGIGDAIAAAVEQGSNYYTLSYSPLNKNYDGRFRKIKVALEEKGYHLHYRPGYFADDPYAPAKDAAVARNMAMAAMQHGSPQSRQIRFAVRVVPIGPKKKIDNSKQILIASRKKPVLPATVEVQHYRMDFAVDSSDLHFIPQENGGHSSKLNLMIAAYDGDGRQISGLSAIWAGNLSPAAYDDVVSGGVRIEQELDVPVPAVSLRLGIEDQMSNSLGTVELPLPVADAPDMPRTVRHSLPEIEPN